MTTAAKMQKVTLQEMFDETVSGVEWGTIDEICDHVKGNEHLVTALLANDVATMKENLLKQKIRHLLKTTKNEVGHAAYASVKTVDANGKETTIYKQETLFNIEDYQQVTAFHGKRKVYHASEEKYYATRGEQKFSVQIALFGS